MSRSTVAVSGPSLDDGTVQALSALDQEIRYVDLGSGEWQRLDGASIYVLGGTETLDARAVGQLPKSVELVCFLGTGYESYMDVGALSDRGIESCYTPHANAKSTAEFAIALLLMGLRSIPTGLDQIARCEWDPPQGRSLFGASIGIVGFGHVGREVTRILRDGFGVSPYVWNRSNQDEDIDAAGAVPRDLGALFQSCSAVMLHANTPAPDAPALISEELLALAAPDLVIVNTARAGLIEPTVLGTFLRARPDVRFLSDVYYTEPVCSATDQWDLLTLGTERFTLTPHMAYGSDHSNNEMGKMLVSILHAHLNGEPLPHLTQRN